MITPRIPTHPRGNTMILVTAVLVLLVVIAVAFLSRAQAGRQVSSAQQQAAQRDDRAYGIALEVADLVGEALFPQPIDPGALNAAGAGFRADPGDSTVRTATTSWPRLATRPDARRYGIDRDVDGDLFPDFNYNAATYAVSPWTNWPDFLSPNFPRGPGQPNGLLVNPAGVPIGDGNPYGNPGFGDTRWLRSTEPVRVDTDGDGVPDAFSHWAHLSWLPTANNGWRVVKDISDIMGTVLTNANESNFAQPFALAMPYEQWLPNVVPGPTNPANFVQRRDAWFGAPSGANYSTVYATGNALPNLFRLADLKTNPAGPPQPLEEFVPGTPRNVVSRTFTDTDGDGFTDSFWFLAPTSVERSVRTVVGVSIVDNSALLNANVATRFDRTNTTGAHPGDLALVSDVGVGFLDTPTNSMASASANFPTLYRPFDTIANLYPPVFVGWNPIMFGDGDNLQEGLSFLQAVGMKSPFDFNQTNAFLTDSSFPADRRGEFHSPLERLGYFRSLVNPLEPQYGLTPFGTSDELELRMYHGSNHPFVMSRFERTLNRREPQGSGIPERWFLRSDPSREETSEYLDQLTNRQLLLDNRRKLTLFSGARNDLLPPWLWPTAYFDPRIDYNRDGLVTIDPTTGATNEDARPGDFFAYERQLRKLDLRRAMDDAPVGAPPPSIQQQEENRRQWRIDLNRLLERTLTRTWGTDANGQWQSYLGRRDLNDPQAQRRQFTKTRSMAASLTANIDQYRDRGEIVLPGNVVVDQPLHPVLGVRDPIDPNLVYIGQEKHPFIVEVFFALVYPKSKISPQARAELVAAGLSVGDDFRLPNVFDDGGEYFVDSTSKPAVVVAVQIANPYDTPINLADVRLRLFGKSFNFNSGPYGIGPTLGPATVNGPTTATVFAIREQLGEWGGYPGGFSLGNAWIDFLDIRDGELYVAPGDNPASPTRSALRFNASSLWLTEDTQNPAVSPNSAFNDREGFSVELVRNIVGQPGPGAPQPAAVVLDRFDNYVSGNGVRFAESVSRLFEDERLFPPQADYEIQLTSGTPPQPIPDRCWYNGIRLGDKDFYVAWTRASRLWTWDAPKDLNGDGIVELDERDGVFTPDEDNPRYVFSFASEPVRPTASVRGSVSGTDRDFLGNVFAATQAPDTGNPDQLWISYTYVNIFGATRRGKPCFFNNQVIQPEGPLANGNNAYGGAFVAPNPGGGYPNTVVIGDKGLQLSDYREALKRLSLRSPLQMLHKDGDFEQVGEILNVFCWGPVVNPAQSVTQPVTVRTFAEIMLQEDDDEDQPAGRGVFVNRLRAIPYTDPAITGENAFANRVQATDGPTPVLGTPPNAPYVPALPAGTALLDALVCDDRGLVRLDGIDGSPPNGLISQAELNVAERFRPRNAVAFSGRSTPGLLNLNTATPEALRAMPLMHFLVNDNSNYGGTGGANPPDIVDIPFQFQNSAVRVVDSILRYRDRTLSFQPGVIVPPSLNANVIPGYADRGIGAEELPGLGGFLGPIRNASGTILAQGMRNERGIQSVGELMLLQRTVPNAASDNWSLHQSYSIQYAGLDPYRSSVGNPAAGGFAYANGVVPRFSIDRNSGNNAQRPLIPDRVAGDAEKRNLLLSGISNLVTTRSDVFTVYLRIRSVRQDPVTGRWDGTNPDLIVDDSRYVMLVDRGGVDRPGQRPKILYLEKAPN